MRPPIPSFSLSRRARIALITVGVIILLLIIGSSFVGVFVDWLWFGSVGYRGVFTSVIWTRFILFIVFGLITAVGIGANMVIAFRVRPPFRPMSSEQQNLERYRVALEPRKRLILAAVMIIVGLAAGASAQGGWRTWLLFFNGGSFGVKDPQFHRDISFFAWDYPAYRTLLGFGFSLVIFSLLFSVAVHYLVGAIRLQTPGPKMTIAARRHVTILVFLFIVLKAIAYWFDRYGLVFSNRGKVTGASYTDVNASLPAKTILFWIAVIIAIGVLASLWLKSALLPVTGFVVLLILSIVINGIYPAIVQQVTVKPNASQKEAKYISRNIQATRAAYGIQSGTAVDYITSAPESQPATSSLTSTNPTVSDIRILDPNQVSLTFQQQQQLKSYYGFASKLDIDRYTVDGTKQDFIVGVRELDAGNLTGDQTNWINEHTLYTHGYGLVAAAANVDVTSGTGSVAPAADVGSEKAYTEGGIPSTGPLGLKNPAAYYGELLPNYSIVGAKGSPQEFDGIGANKVTYAGSGGVSLGNVFNRLAFAIQYKQTNFLLNGSASANGAKIIYNRDPRQIVQKVAPFLKIDGDPYPIVDTSSGDIVWVLDGYTTLSNYPYSEQESLSSLTSDSLSETGKTAKQPNDTINYIRNSVKATVDAYTGKVTLYQWDNTDPVLKAWMKIFPKVVKPKSDMPASITAHIRYPQDLFEVQRSLIGTYHVDDPVQFYNQSDKWTVPSDPNDASTKQPPYYVLASPADGANQNAQFQLTTPMEVNGRPYLAAYMSVDSDPGPNYGKITVLRLPSSPQINGPAKISSIFNSNTVISKDITLFSGSGSNVLHGNLLTLPIGNSFLYVEPLYIKATSGTGTFPVLARVLVVYGDKIGYANDLSDAIKNLDEPVVGQSINVGSVSGSSTPTPTPTPTPTGSGSSTSTPTPTPTSGSTSLDAILSQLDAAYLKLQSDYKTGNLATIGQDQQNIAELLQQYASARASSSSSPSPTATKTS
jgi:uncharacterized membrane protein (UPF0182 family)